jgi:hypothetical protein
MVLTTTQHGEHHVTVPRHDALRLGTVRVIVAAVASHFQTSPDEERLFG